MRLAQVAARRDARKAGALQAALDHPNEVMRYWAATGLLILGKAPPSARETDRDRRT